MKTHKTGGSQYATAIDEQGNTWRVRREKSPAKGYGRDFFIMFEEAALILAKNKKINGTALRVFIWCTVHLNYETYKLFRQIDLANELECNQGGVAKALSKLCDEGYLEKRGTKARTEYRLSTKATWKGSAPQYYKVMRQRHLEIVSVTQSQVEKR